MYTGEYKLQNITFFKECPLHTKCRETVSPCFHLFLSLSLSFCLIFFRLYLSLPSVLPSLSFSLLSVATSNLSSLFFLSSRLSLFYPLPISLFSTLSSASLFSRFSYPFFLSPIFLSSFLSSPLCQLLPSLPTLSFSLIAKIEEGG